MARRIYNKLSASGNQNKILTSNYTLLRFQCLGLKGLHYDQSGYYIHSPDGLDH
jgi:hypothetical protein